MKLLKIGSNPSCDIVLNNDYVSGHHADLTLLDNGDIIIEDKDSTNGTFVGNKKLNPNQETPIRRGDYVRFAGETLSWARVPVLENNAKYKMVVNIGTNYRNNVVINSPSVSRYHASLKIDKSGKAFLIDNGSKNGTQINGIRIPANKPTRVKRGDNVICGSEDITDQLTQFIKPSVPTWAWVSAVAALGVAAVVAIVMLVPGLFTGGGKPGDYKSAVVYVFAAYHYEVTLKDNPLAETDLLTLETKKQYYQATAFFLDDKGRMGTNRHVAMPWAEEYRETGVTENLKQEYQKWLVEQLQVSNLEVFNVDIESIMNAVYLLKRSDLGVALLNKCDEETSSKPLVALKAMIDRIQKSEVEIKGVLDFITVGYPGQYYTNLSEFQRCHVVCSSNSKDIDLAILQLNENKTPASVTTVYEPAKINTKVLEPQKDKLYIWGYPNGIQQNMEESSYSLEPNLKTSRCSKTPGKYEFELQEMVQGGSSGSPVFNTKGELVGVVTSGYTSTNVSYAVQARHLKKMYDEEVLMNNGK